MLGTGGAARHLMSSSGPAGRAYSAPPAGRPHTLNTTTRCAASRFLLLLLLAVKVGRYAGRWTMRRRAGWGTGRYISTAIHAPLVARASHGHPPAYLSRPDDAHTFAPAAHAGGQRGKKSGGLVDDAGPPIAACWERFFFFFFFHAPRRVGRRRQNDLRARVQPADYSMHGLTPFSCEVSSPIFTPTIMRPVDRYLAEVRGSISQTVKFYAPSQRLN